MKLPCDPQAAVVVQGLQEHSALCPQVVFPVSGESSFAALSLGRSW